MASIVTGKNGRRLIQFTGLDGRTRPKIRLGKVTKKQAQSARSFVEDLLASKITGDPLRPTTMEWIAGVPKALRDRLETVGLVKAKEQAECPTLAVWVQAYVDGRQDVKGATATVYGHTQRNLQAFFGGAKGLDEITPGDADSFRVFLKMQEGLADNTVRRRMGIAKQFFQGAVRQKLIGENPFDGQATLVRANPRRQYFVSREDTRKVLDACPDAPWRLVFALCRYGGLRCASEITRLTWTDVNWEKMVFTVHASKTEHHKDGGVRVVPIFHELYPHFQDAFEQAEEGATYCCPQYPNANQLYRKAMLRIIKQAGLKPWPKLFQNCRASRETELAEEYPIQVVCAWIGNSPQVASKHYLQVTEAHHAKAVQNPVQTAAVGGGQDLSGPDKDEDKLTARPVGRDNYGEREAQLMGRTGLEPVTSCVSSRRSSQLS